MPQVRTHSGGAFSLASGLPPHGGIPLMTVGADVSSARTLVILVHGRGAGADGIVGLAEELQTEGVAFVVPEASGRTWYPFSFLSPIVTNEPGLSSGLSVIDGITVEAERLGFTSDRVALIGFSQGACLTLEYASRHPKRYHVIAGLSGGLIGPPGSSWPVSGSFEGTPVFLGCSDRDPHIPAERVKESAGVFEKGGAVVDMRLYGGMPHTVNDDEIEILRGLLKGYDKLKRHSRKGCAYTE
jgi:predicted esterase